MKRIFSLFIITLSLLTLIACGGEKGELLELSANINVGEYGEVGLKGMKTSEVTFTSEDPSIATVNEEGVFIGLKPGFTTIVVSKGKHEWMFFVTVEGLPLNIDLVETNVGLSVDETLEINVNSNDINGLSYVSDNVEIVKVNSDGILTGVSVGTTTVTIKSNTNPLITRTLNVEVYDDIFISVSDQLEMFDNEELLLEVETNDHIGLTFSSSDSNIITIDNVGLIVAKNKGSATITITSKFDQEVTKTVLVTVLNFEEVQFNRKITNTINLENYTLKITTKELIDDKNHYSVLRLKFDGQNKMLDAGHIMEYFTVENGTKYHYYFDKGYFVKEEVSEPLFEEFLLYEDFKYENFSFKSNNKYSLNFNSYNLLDKFIELFDEDGTILNFELVMEELYIKQINFDLYFNDHVIGLSIEIVDIDETLVEVPNV